MGGMLEGLSGAGILHGQHGVVSPHRSEAAVAGEGKNAVTGRMVGLVLYGMQGHM